MLSAFVFHVQYTLYNTFHLHDKVVYTGSVSTISKLCIVLSRVVRRTYFINGKKKMENGETI